MTTMVDFLPASYREATLRRRARRDRVLLAIPIVLALVAVDVVLRTRVAGVREMARLARQHAAFGAQLSEEAKTLAAEAERLRTGIDELARPLAARRMIQIVDELLAERPAGIVFHDLVVHQTPWAEDSVPTITLGASCRTADELRDYLALVRERDALPPLQCQRTDEQRQGAEVAFQLDSKDPRRAR